MLTLTNKLLNKLQRVTVVLQYFCNKSTKSIVNEEPHCKRPKRALGQPTYLTHPHLLKSGEVTPLISVGEFQERRQKLVEGIVTYTSKNSKKSNRHIIVIPSANKQYMSDKIPYVFRQNSEFLYLTGCLEPDSCLVLTTSDTPSQHCATLFLRDNDTHSELWDGPRTGPEEGAKFFGVDQSLSVSELENFFTCYMKSNSSTTLWYDVLSPVQQNVHKIMSNFFKTTNNKQWESPKAFIHRLRVIKSPAEVALMQTSCDIASDAIVKTISTSKPGINEHQIFAQVDYECRMHGAEMLAYPPVVAGGDRATIIHYINNNQIICDGDNVLMDAGCEYHGYSSDITRTWPISGKFTATQRTVYEAVLNVQQDLIAKCANFPTLDKLFDYMILLLGEQLRNIGLISRNAGAEILQKSAYQFCPHHVSHYLGIDVHDTPTVPRSIRIVPGMIITVEPGLYFNKKHKVPEEFKGIGIRIEDDILITENGPVVLSKKCPKSVADIESIASQKISSH